MINLLLKLKEILIVVLFAFGAVFGIYQSAKTSAKKDQQLKDSKDDAEYFKSAIAEKERISKLSHSELVYDILHHKNRNNL